MPHFKRLSFVLPVLLWCCLGGTVQAQDTAAQAEKTPESAQQNPVDPDANPEAEPEPEPPPPPPTLEERLINITHSIDSTEKDRAALERELKRTPEEEAKTRLRQEITEMEDIIAGLRDEYVNLATNGTDLFSKKPKKDSSYDWRVDLELIIQPLLDQLKQLTERPRKLEQLESDIRYWSKREADLANSITALTQNLEQLKDKKQIKQLQDLLDTAQSRHKSTQKKLALLKSDLEQHLNTETSVWTSLMEGGKAIFINMGLNLGIALAAALIVYHVIGLLGHIPVFLLHQRGRQYIFVERTINLIKRFVGALLAVLVYTVILYTLAEWVILLLSFALIVAVLMSIKSVLPQYLVEIRTLLNLGSVRQGERLVYRGLPWKVSQLDVYTHLHNPQLDGHLRVPLTELSRLSSRPYHKDEPWFPTKMGDVVQLEDGVFGTVIRQTPEQVQLDLGGSVFTYPCALFLGRRPQNLSTQGFSAIETFGVDYGLQSEITGAALEIYRREMELALEQSDFAEHLEAVIVDFSFANSSSLDFKTIARFNGNAAGDYYAIKRFIQKTSVEIANQHGWTIPFQQLTVHSVPRQSLKRENIVEKRSPQPALDLEAIPETVFRAPGR